MAPVVFTHPVSYAAIAAPCIHVASAIYLTYTVASSLLTSYRALSPPQDTRSRTAKRQKLLPVFISLAVLAFLVSLFSAADGALLSYKVWADSRGVILPYNFSYRNNFLTGKGHKDLYLGQWLTDTSIYHDTLEIVVEKSRRFWWGQQIDLASLSWSMLVAIEGRRRGIRNLPAFVTLAHLVNLSYAQNLFYIALLVTPAPVPISQQDLVLPANSLPGWTRLRRRLLSHKPNEWHPRPFIFYSSALLGLGSIFLLPYAAGTITFTKIATLARLSTLLPVLAPYVVPTSWGRIYGTPHEGYSSLKGLLRTVAMVSLLLYGKASAIGLSHNAPNSQYHRHSALLPWDIVERTEWERSTTAIGKILGAISDHPAMQAVGFDVLISTFSLGVWAAVRSADVTTVLGAVVPFADKLTGKISTVIEKSENVKQDVKHDLSKLIGEASDDDESLGFARRTRRGRSRNDSVSSAGQGESQAVTTTGRRKGRSKKIQPAEDKQEEAYEPTPAEVSSAAEGDILPSGELDWESGALVWGLTALCGLGSASSGVFSAECTSR